MNALVVDDKEIVRQSIANCLESGGIICTQASSYEDAVSKSDGVLFDVIVVDIVLGGKSGDDFARWYKENYPQTKVFLVTGKGISFVADLEVERLYEKPLDMHQLLKDIKGERVQENRDTELCRQHTEELRGLSRKFDIYEVKQNQMYVALCGGIDKDGKHIEGQLSKWKSTHTFMKILTSIMSAIGVAFVGAAFKCAPVVIKAANIVESSQ